MGLFSNSSPFDTCVERATSEKNTADDWSQIMDVCDKVKESSNGAKDCLKSITKRLNNDNPRVALQAVTLLDACVNNCGRKFLLEVAGREFEQDLQKLIINCRTHPKVSQHLRESLKKWSENEFKGDPELSLIPALYNKLQKDGYEFDFPSDSPKKGVKYSTDPNVVHSAQEEEDIAKAIQLSLEDKGSNSYHGTSQGIGSQDNSSGLYSSASAVLASDSSIALSAPEKEPVKVRALYDFEAAEDNELTFKAGELIVIIDDSDSNWWKGSNHRGEGLFPANFVTSELIEEQSSSKSEGASPKRVSFSECVEVTEVENASSEVVEVSGEIDEDKVNQLLHLLHEADPTGERGDDPSLSLLEEQINAMAPNIDAELERIDKKHAQLARISIDLVDALNLYHELMREVPSTMPYYSSYNKMVNPPPSGPQAVIPPHFLHSNHQNLPPQQIYSSGQYPPYVGPSSGQLPQYLPSMVTSPNQLNSSTTQVSVSSYQSGTHESHGSSSVAPTFNQFGTAGLNEYGGMTSENCQNVAQSSACVPVCTPSTSANAAVSHSYMQHPGHHMAMPQNVPGPQASLPNFPPLGIPLNLQHHLPPTSMPPQPSSIPHQVPSTSIPQPTMAVQGPPTTMPFYAQPQLPQMQQQPLM